MAHGSVLFGECNCHIHFEIWMFEWRYDRDSRCIYYSLANMIIFTVFEMF